MVTLLKVNSYFGSEDNLEIRVTPKRSRALGLGLVPQLTSPLSVASETHLSRRMSGFHARHVM